MGRGWGHHRQRGAASRRLGGARRLDGLPYSDEAFWPTFGMRNADVVPRLYQVAGPPERVAALGERKEAIYRELLAQEAKALPGAKELMSALHAAGYRQAVGSSAPERNIALIVELLGLGHWLEATVSGESVAHGKPAPDIFLAGTERLGVAPERCLVIEDAVAGVQAAHAGGMRCLRCAARGSPTRRGWTPPSMWPMRSPRWMSRWWTDCWASRPSSGLQSSPLTLAG